MAIPCQLFILSLNQNRLHLLTFIYTLIYRKLQKTHIFRINKVNKGVYMIQNPNPNKENPIK